MFGFSKPTVAYQEAQEHQIEVGQLIQKSATLNAQSADTYFKRADGSVAVYKRCLAEIFQARGQGKIIRAEEAAPLERVKEISGILGRALTASEAATAAIELNAGKQPTITMTPEYTDAAAARKRREEDRLLQKAARLKAERESDELTQSVRRHDIALNKQAREDRVAGAEEAERERGRKLTEARELLGAEELES